MDPILTQDAAAQRFDYLSSLPLAKLKQEQEKEKAAGSYTPQTQGLYEALASDKVDGLTAQWATLPSKQIAHEFERGLADGEYDEGLAPVAQEAFSKKFKEERDTSGLDKTGKFLGSAASMVGNEFAAPFTDRESQVVKPFVKGVAKSLRDVVVGTNYLGLGNLGSGVPVEEQQKASDRLFSGAEFGTRQTAGLVKDIFDHEADNQYAAKGDAALGDIFAARRAEQKSLVDAARGAGSLVTHSGVAAPADFNAQDRADVQEMSQALDATNMIPVGGGFKIGASGVSRAVRGIAKSAGIDVLERGAEAVSKTLGGALETGPKRQVLGTPLMTAEEALIRQASTDGLLRKARLAAGRGTVALGETIQKAAKALPAASSTGVAAAGLTLAAGGDAQEALTAGLASLVGRKIIGGKLGLKGLGAGLESAGRAMQKTLPTPFSKTQAAINAFRSEYRPIKSALAAAGLGAAETGLLSLGADSPEEAGGIVGGGATLGALGSGLGTLKAFGRDQLVKNAVGVSGETAKTAVPVKPLGLDPEADKINAEAVSQMTPAGSVFLQTARAMLPDQHVYVAMTGDQAQSIYTRLTGDQTDVRNVNGLTAPTKDGKRLVLIRPAGVDAGITGEAGGHEVTHALKAIGEADPKTRGAWLVVEDEARKALGPVGSEVFEGVREQYQSQMPQGTMLSDQQVVDEFIAEHGSVLLSGLPAGKLGGNKGLSNALSSAFFRLAENAGLRKVGFARDGTEPVTSSTLPYTPSFNLLDALEHAINASRLEASDLVPDASVPVEPPKPAVAKPAVAPEAPKAPPTFNAGEGILKPIPTTLATDQSLGTATPPQQPIAPKPETAKAAPEPRDFLYTVQKGEGNVPGYVQIDDVTDKANRESGSLEKFRERGYDLPDVPESLPQGQYTLDQIKEAVAKEKASAPPTEKSVNGALRGQEVQAARTESVAPLSPTEEKQLKDVQPDVAKQDVARKVWESVKALGGQRIGLPVFEAAVNQDGVVRSKRVAPYSIEVSSGGKVTVLTVDMDRANYNGKLLFDWAAAQGTPERFGYAGITDPKFVSDLGTYLRNQAEGRRGSGETLTAEGVPPATGKPVGTLTREQEQFFNILMGQTPPKELTTRSALAIARIRATAKASGVEPIKTEGGSVEPNALRDALRKEGAPIDRIGEDPDPTRRQSNPKDRNSVIARIRLQDFESLTPTGQSVSQPNIRAIEASFMPSNRAEPFDSGPIGSGWLDKDGNFQWAAAVASHDTLAQKLGFKNIEDAQKRGGLIRSWADRDDRVFTVGVDQFSELSPRQQKRVEDLAIENRGAVRDDRGNIVLDYRDEAKAPQFMPPASRADAAAQKDWLAEKAKTAGFKKLKDVPPELFNQWATEWRTRQTETGVPSTAPVASIQDFQSPDRVKQLPEKRGWAIMTAENPNAERLSPEANKALNDKFQQDQKARGVELTPAVGKYGTEENSFVLTDPKLTFDKAVELAKEYNQESVLTPYGLVYADGSLLPIKGIQTFDKPPSDFYTKVGDTYFSAEFAREFGDPLPADSVEVQSLKASEAAENAVATSGPVPSFMPSLKNAKVKGNDVQFKRERPIKGAVGGVLDIVHFSSKDLKQIDPAKSFGKGAATQTDRMGAPKAFFYAKGTAYEAPIAGRSNVYTAKVDGNSIYDLNTDALGVQSIVNREKRDEAIMKAGFKGFYAETPGFDAVAIYDPIDVTPALRQDVMTPEQLKTLGLGKQEAPDAGELSRSEIVRSPAFEKARAQIAKKVGSSSNGAFFDAVDQWVDERLANAKVRRLSSK